MTSGTASNLLRHLRVGIARRISPSARRTVLGLGDQAIVSGSRFLLTVLMGRLCGAEELGFYGLAFTVIVLFACAQEALITLPYTARQRRRHGRRAEFYAGSVLLQSLTLSLTAAVGLLLWIGGQTLLGGETRQVAVIAVVALFLPAIMLWEFARRIGFAQLRVERVFVLDALTAAGWLAGVALFAFFGQLSALTAYLAIGTSCGLVATIWLGSFGQKVRFCRRRLAIDSRRHWRFGRWILGSETLLMARGYVVPWLVVWLLGTRETGILIAYLTVVFLANPILIGISNVLAPDLARAFADGGVPQIKRLVTRSTWILGAVMLGFCLILAAIGNTLVVHLYGVEFAGRSYCVVALAIGLLAEAIAMPTYNGLWAIHRPDVCFFACFIGLVATIGVTLGMTSTLGLLGAAIGFSSGKVVAALVQAVWARSVFAAELRRMA